LVLKTSLGLDYRGLEGLLDDSADLCQLIGLESVPHYTTFQKASRKLLANSLVQVETVVSMIKRRLGNHVRARTRWGQVRELGLVVLTHNLMILWRSLLFYRASRPLLFR
jgi:hypothetical protein